jgi:hypothetical protein
MHCNKPRAWFAAPRSTTPSARPKNDRTKPGALELPNHARNGKVSAETCDASRPTPNAQAAGRQEPPCSASTPPPTQLPAQPKPRSVLHETLQSCAQAPALPRSISEIHAFLTPINSLTPLFPASRRIWARLCENRGRVRAGTRRFFGSWSCSLHEGRSSRRRMRPSIRSPRRRGRPALAAPAGTAARHHRCRYERKRLCH